MPYKFRIVVAISKSKSGDNWHHSTFHLKSDTTSRCSVTGLRAINANGRVVVTHHGRKLKHIVPNDTTEQTVSYAAVDPAKRPRHTISRVAAALRYAASRRSRLEVVI